MLTWKACTFPRLGHTPLRVCLNCHKRERQIDERTVTSSFYGPDMVLFDRLEEGDEETDQEEDKGTSQEDSEEDELATGSDLKAERCDCC